MEQVLLQRLNDGLFVDEAASPNVQEALIRNVGCARMRAALLQRAAEQHGASLAFGLSDSAEYSEDDAGDVDGGGVSFTAWAANSDAAAAVTSNGNVGSGSSEDGRARILKDQSADGSGYEQYYSADIDAEQQVANAWANADDERHAEYYGADEFEYEEYEYDEYYGDYTDGYGGDETTFVAEGSAADAGAVQQHQEKLVSAQPAWERDGWDDLMLAVTDTSRYDVEARVLKLLGDVDNLPVGGRDQEYGIGSEDATSTTVSSGISGEAASASSSRFPTTVAAGTTEADAAGEAKSSAGEAAVAEGAARQTVGSAENAASAVLQVGEASSYADEFGYDSYDLLDKADRLAQIAASVHDRGDDDDDDDDGDDDDDLHVGYEYDLYDNHYQAMTLADVMLSRLDMESDDDEWADYLEQAYEYFTFYMEDDSYSEYDSYNEYGTLDAADAPSALVALASIAELVMWAHMGSFVMEVRPAFTVTRTSADGSLIESESVFLITSDASPSYSDDGVISNAAAAVVYALGSQSGPEAWFSADVAAQDVLTSPPQPTLEIMNDFSLRLTYPDGSVNWGLVTMLILSAGTMAMLVGLVASWLSLRRSMECALRGWVYVPPQRAAKRCGKGGFMGKGGDSDAPLVLQPEDIKGAVCWGSTPAVPAVEDASRYVSAKLENESIAKALNK